MREIVRSDVAAGEWSPSRPFGASWPGRRAAPRPAARPLAGRCTERAPRADHLTHDKSGDARLSAGSPSRVDRRRIGGRPSRRRCGRHRRASAALLGDQRRRPTGRSAWRSSRRAWSSRRCSAPSSSSRPSFALLHRGLQHARSSRRRPSVGTGNGCRSLPPWASEKRAGSAEAAGRAVHHLGHHAPAPAPCARRRRAPAAARRNPSGPRSAAAARLPCRRRSDHVARRGRRDAPA